MNGTQFDLMILDLAGRQAGAVASSQVLGRGGTYDQLMRRERGGRLRRVVAGLYVHAGFAACWEQDLWLALLDAGPGSAVCGRAAAGLHRIRHHGRKAVEIATSADHNRLHVPGTAHETFWLPREHVTTVNGVPVTSVARTVFDLAGMPRHPWAFRDPDLRDAHTARIASLVNIAIRDHGMLMSELHAVLAATGRRGKAGTAIIRAIVADLDVDYRPLDSELEELFMGMVRSGGLPEPETQVELGSAHRWIGRVDFLFRKWRLIVEIDGRTHAAPLDRRADRVRDEQLTAEGWRVVRFTWWDLVHEPERVIASLRSLLAVAA